MRTEEKVPKTTNYLGLEPCAAQVAVASTNSPSQQVEIVSVVLRPGHHWSTTWVPLWSTMTRCARVVTHCFVVLRLFGAPPGAPLGRHGWTA
jgi:hypothetical protein